ncbi:chemotaxis protein CheB [Mucilaginibacter sp. CAU 1740]|uniref:chemotaxis protein CheB n=1 Tax=Mucilaginibacter sp. CAU 1740 TaxID=3140365 RepID=UPI00325AF98C
MEKKISDPKAVIIGGSAGSLKVILEIVRNLDKDFLLPVIIIIHRKNDPESALIDVLSEAAVLPTKEAEDKEFILSGTIYLAPAGYHLLIEQDYSFSLDSSEKVHFSRPSIDVSFQCAADAYGERLIAILLSGANEDGTKGFEEIKKNGGVLIAQEPLTAEAPYMPAHAIRYVSVDYICSIVQIGPLIRDYCSSDNTHK